MTAPQLPPVRFKEVKIIAPTIPEPSAHMNEGEAASFRAYHAELAELTYRPGNRKWRLLCGKERCSQVFGDAHYYDNPDPTRGLMFNLDNWFTVDTNGTYAYGRRWQRIADENKRREGTLLEPTPLKPRSKKQWPGLEIDPVRKLIRVTPPPEPERQYRSKIPGMSTTPYPRVIVMEQLPITIRCPRCATISILTPPDATLYHRSS